MKTILKLNVTLFLLFTASFHAQEQENTVKPAKGFYVKPYFGGSFISDFTAIIIDGTSQNVKITNTSGFDAGINFGYDFENKFGLQLGWEYKTNDIEATINNQTFKGNYASNMFTFDAVYTFDRASKFRPYIGAGLSFIQEIDLDYTQNTQGNSYATDGKIGFQGFLGLNYQLLKNWSLLGELRNTQFSKINMTSENAMNNARLIDLKYNPTTFNIGIKYNF